MNLVNPLRLVALCVISFLIFVGSCSPTTNVDAPEDAQVQRSPTDGDEASDYEGCKAAGGSVERRGMLNRNICVIPFADAGKACHDSQECEGRCLTTPGAVKGKETGGGVVGTCQKDNTRFGCSAEVKVGVAGPGLCID